MPSPLPPSLRPLLALSLLLALACGDEDPATPDAGESPPDAGSSDAAPAVDAGPAVEPLDLPALPAANAVSEDDPRYQGMLRFLWDSWGVEVYEEWPPAEFFLQLMEEEPEVFGDQLAAFGFVADPNDDFPVGFKRGLSDPSRVYQTCALCHVGELPDGRVWLGLPNGRLDFGRFRREVNARWVAAGNAPFVTALQLEKGDQLGPGRFHAESSEYEQVVPADFPAYFGLADRSHLNYLGTGGNVRTEVYMAIFSFGAGNPNPMEALVPFPERARVDVLLGFFGAIPAPEGPPQDAAAVARGEALFERERCGECHHPGDPGADPIVPYAPDGIERLPGDDPDFERGTIATSRLHRVLIEGDEMGGGTPSDEGRENLIRFIIGNRLAVSMSDGYRTADLRGVWATAPYLHNGSVPTLEDLLRPAAERPVTFERDGFTVDTTVAGSSNEGHEFGTDLTEEERASLVAYLRTL
ncbi:MAG TPA: c-type cytochrome [Polyangiaceae bacterium LLY-WYZ-15_(1-7)]|nr:c-type cytochrome [Polyangiaceae bacterium LLY-WYZ-15_(1-7)]HJL13071.1 c-type cytochrome [Polyangiaceae bacterium LLY-WYZ-15_(1-7)]HJL28477.1 c-type cytochrome [Polyangiaceae bacterium LLY-WYZ-15_(1-7)]HJL44446.1 c-type cytochrome [Polyangiaceae bacterium LLY-WYZ-15_(1-7)]